MTDPSEPTPVSNDDDLAFSDLTWHSISFGAVMGTLNSMIVVNWFTAGYQGAQRVAATLLMLIFAILSFAQLRIGIGLLQKHHWAVLASYRTNLALLILGAFSLLLNLSTGATYAVLPFLSLGWAIWAIHLFHKSTVVQTLLEKND